MMARWLSRKMVAALAIGLLLAMAVPWVAFADDISNNLDGDIDATAEVMTLNVGGANGTTTLYVTPRNGDGKNGCNLTGSTTLTVSVASSSPSVATVSPSSVTFTSCSDTKILTVTPGLTGSATISLGLTSNTTGGTFDLAPATFTVNVAPPANTAPSVSVIGVTNGASYAKGSVPAATCNVTDAQDGNSSFAATLSAITGPYATDGIGSQTANCSYTDGGGLTALDSVTYNIVDLSAPDIAYTLNPASPDGSNGWYKNNVTLTWTVTEAESPSSLVKTGCVDQNITADQAEATYSCSATSAGGSADPVSVSIKRDATAPSIADKGVIAGTSGSNGWYTSAVTNQFEATDNLSGIAGQTNPYTFNVSSGTAEGSAIKINSGTVTDVAGNTAAAIDSSEFKIDLTDPTNVAFVDGPAAGGSYYFGSVPAAPSCTATDAVSGLASCVVTGYSNATGLHTLTATATDNAGRTATATRSYTILAWTLNGFYQPVDMNGVLNTVKAGSTVPLKFEIFKGSTESTNVADIEVVTTSKYTCTNGTPEDAIEATATGGTSLRYDATAGQFVYNWQTPKTPGVCYAVTMKTLDGSVLTAKFKLK